MIYFDSNYIVRCYLREQGSAEVLSLAQKAAGCCSLALAKTECAAAFHRHCRENSISEDDLHNVLNLFAQDETTGVWTYFPVTDSLLNSACARLRALSSRTYCRSADALHLTCAAEQGFQEIYSHDRHLLAAAPAFGLKGIDIIPKS